MSVASTTRRRPGGEGASAASWSAEVERAPNSGRTSTSGPAPLRALRELLRRPGGSRRRRAGTRGRRPPRSASAARTVVATAAAAATAGLPPRRTADPQARVRCAHPADRDRPGRPALVTTGAPAKLPAVPVAVRVGLVVGLRARRFRGRRDPPPPGAGRPSVSIDRRAIRLRGTGQQAGQACGVEGGRHGQHAEVGPQRRPHVEGQRQRQVAVEVALVHLVEDHQPDAGQGRVVLQAAGEQALGDDLDAGRGRHDLLVAGAVPGRTPTGSPSRWANRRAHRPGREPPGLQHHDAVVARRPVSTTARRADAGGRPSTCRRRGEPAGRRRRRRPAPPAGPRCTPRRVRSVGRDGHGPSLAHTPTVASTPRPRRSVDARRAAAGRPATGRAGPFATDRRQSATAGPADDALGYQSNEQLARHAVALAVLLGPVSAHVPPTDDAGPVPYLVGVVGDGDPTDERDIPERRGSSSKQIDTRGSRRIALALTDESSQLNTIDPPSTATHTGTTWGLPSSRIVASLPVRGLSARKTKASASVMRDIDIVLGCGGRGADRSYPGTGVRQRSPREASCRPPGPGHALLDSPGFLTDTLAAPTVGGSGGNGAAEASR